ncbi:hypothetical protein KKA23_01595 [Patescibacteria group bacterium]|nr:hypothetical protein [Patescibacteria group bacterium]MBU3922610.1 hypothetical protein [Patescibacteria group bacterium]
MNQFEKLKIEGDRIPDEDVDNWIKSLQDGGFSDKEIDLIVENLNVDYKKRKNPDFVEEELEKLKKYLFDKIGRSLTQEEIDYLTKGIRNRLED